jgi:hypothetical protein
MTSSIDADLGMGMQMKNESSATNILHVIGSGDKNYTLSSTLIKLVISMDMMGEQKNYDSEKEADKDSEIGKTLSKKLNIPDTIPVEISTGIVQSKTTKTMPSPEKPENPMDPMMEAMGSSTDENVGVENAFFILPAGKKPGDSWADSSMEKNMKTVKTYIFKSLDKNIATINLAGSVTGTGQMEMQGMQVDISMNSITTGDIIVDTKTGLVSKRTVIGDINGTLNLMGQSMPVMSKTNSTYVYQQ